MMNKQKWNRKQKHWSSVLALIGVIGGFALVSDDGFIPVANAAQDDMLVYVPVASPCRIVNTRNTISTHLIDTASRDFFSYGTGITIADQGGNPVGCDHPRSADGWQPAAIAATIAAVGKQASGNGNIVAYPAGSAAPSASTVNYTTAANIANSTIITLRTSDGSFTLLSNFSDVPAVVDVVGYFYPIVESLVTDNYSVSVPFSTSFGPCCSEVLVATCPVGWWLTGGGVSCFADTTDFNFTNFGVITDSLPVGSSMIGGCASDALTYDQFKNGPGITVTAVCQTFFANTPLQLQALQDPISGRQVTPSQGSPSDEALLILERMKTEAVTRGTFVGQ